MASPDPTPTEPIATHSVGEGLDFACNLLATALGRVADRRPDAAPKLLAALAEYISYRYAGEDLLALETLVLLSRELTDLPEIRWSQFSRQVEWIAREMEDLR
jgi:hypothetical protein